MYELYFRINGGEPELQGTFYTEERARKHMQYLIDTRSNIKSHYIRMIPRDGYCFYDYGAHNAFYIIKEVEG